MTYTGIQNSCQCQFPDVRMPAEGLSGVTVAPGFSAVSQRCRNGIRVIHYGAREDGARCALTRNIGPEMLKPATTSPAGRDPGPHMRFAKPDSSL